MTSNTRWVDAGGERLFCRIDLPEPGTPPTVLMLHGGGPAAGEQYQYLAEALVAERRGVVRFDHSGQGQSTGDLKASSLARRADEARAVVRELAMKVEVLVATSMAGGLVPRLGAEWNPEALVLFCPAAYAADAWDLRFGQGFTERIRESNSWQDSDLLDRLSSFRGRVLEVRGDQDDVIPPGVDQLWDRALAGATRRSRLTVSGCPHPIHRWVVDRPTDRAAVVGAVVDLVTGRNSGR